jgi:fumarylacetoacetase
VRPIDDTHDPALRSWVESANASTDFPIQNLPFGVFRRAGSGDEPRIGVAIGDEILDLVRCREAGRLDGLSSRLLDAVRGASLNALMALGPDAMASLRPRLVQILSARDGAPDPTLLVRAAGAELLLPAIVGDYTDFYASIHHATNVGRLFRPEHPLLPNFKHLPVGYHGRCSSIVPSGTPIVRPAGQSEPVDAEAPRVGPSTRLDYELELGAFIGPGNEQGRPIALDDAEAHLFGVCLLNDWSARDIQAWESQPLGPFLAKSFATTISPWVVTLEALAPFRSPASARPPDDPMPLPYLRSDADRSAGGFDIAFEVFVRSAAMRASRYAPLRVSRNAFRLMYWTLAQMVAHHTSNGCNLRPGDLLGSGTISGPSDDSLGCLLEITRGARPIQLPTGETRTFLEDGDEVFFRGRCERAGYVSIGLGECRGTIVAAAAPDGAPLRAQT